MRSQIGKVIQNCCCFCCSYYSCCFCYFYCFCCVGYFCFDCFYCDCEALILTSLKTLTCFGSWILSYGSLMTCFFVYLNKSSNGVWMSARISIFDSNVNKSVNMDESMIEGLSVSRISNISDCYVRMDCNRWSEILMFCCMGNLNEVGC